MTQLTADELMEIMNEPLPLKGSKRQPKKFRIEKKAYSITILGKPAVAPLMEILEKYEKHPESINPEHLSIITTSMADINDETSCTQMLDMLKRHITSLTTSTRLSENHKLLYQEIFDTVAAMNPEETARNLTDWLDDSVTPDIEGKTLTVVYMTYVPKDKRAVKPLLQIIRQYNDPDNGDHDSLAAAAAEALGSIGDPESLPEILDLTQSKHETIRYNATLALEMFAETNYTKELEQALPRLIELLRDTDENVRVEAAEALGYMQNEKALNPLISILNDEIPFVREQAATSLGELKDERAVESLRARLVIEDDEDVKDAIESSIELIECGEEEE